MTRETRRHLSRERLGALLDAYGADPDRWPADERGAALALLEEDAAARALREHAARLDAVLATVEEASPSPALVERILAAAPATAVETRRPPVSRGVNPRGAVRGRNAWRYFSAGLPLAAAAALALWLASSPEETPASPETLAALGTYETPGDELLTTSEVDLFEDPWLDCTESELGCLDDAEVEDGEPRSDAPKRMRILT